MTEDRRNNPPPRADDLAEQLAEHFRLQTQLHRHALAERATLHRRFLAVQARTAALLTEPPDARPRQAERTQAPASAAGHIDAHSHTTTSTLAATPTLVAAPTAVFAPIPAPMPAAAPAPMPIAAPPPIPMAPAVTIALDALHAAPRPTPEPAAEPAAEPASPREPQPPAPSEATQPGRQREHIPSGLHRTPLRAPRHRRNTTAFTNPIVVVRPPVPTEPRGKALRPVELAPRLSGEDTDEHLLRSFLPTGVDRPAFRTIAGLHRSADRKLASVWADLDIAEDAAFVVQQRLPLDLLLITFDIARALAGMLPTPDDAVGPLQAARLMAHAAAPAAGETVRVEAHLRTDLGPLPQLEAIAFAHGAPLLSWQNVLPPDELPSPNPPLQTEPWLPPRRSFRDRFDEAAVLAFAEGRLLDAGGQGFEPAAAHRCTPHLPTPPNLLLRDVQRFDPGSDTQVSGVLRARLTDGLVNPFALVAAGFQAAGLFLLACGYSLDHDAWNLDLVGFRPVDIAWHSQRVAADGPTTCTLHVRDHGDLPCPALLADLVITRNDATILVAKGLTVQIAPNWPSASLPATPAAPASADNFPTRALHLADRARPTDAFGPLYAPFDGPRHLARPPGGRLLLASRVLDFHGATGTLSVGDSLQTELDLDAAAWFFSASTPGAMPAGIVLEAALWPCRYLALLGGVPLRNERDLYARPTEGTLTQHVEITPDLDKIRLRATVRSVSESPERALLDFDVVVTDTRNVALATLEVAFGLYSAPLLTQTATLPTLQTPEGPGVVDIALIDDQPNGLPADELRLIDRILADWHDGGTARLGRLRARLRVPPDAWFFRDHTFQDPTLPTSIAVEAMLQLLRYAGTRRGWVPLAGALDEPLRWRATGQLLPGDLDPWIEVDLTERRDTPEGPVATARAWLFVGDRAILHAEHLAVRFAADRSEDAQPEIIAPDILDPQRQRWLLDYRPADALPALPMTVAADLLASAAHQSRPEHVVFRLERMVMTRWIVFTTPLRAMTRVELVRGRRSAVIASLAVRPPDVEGNTDWDEVATARMLLAPSYGPCREELPPLLNPRPMDSPYDELFHGPAFHLLIRAEIGDDGAHAVLDLDRCGVPPGEVHPGVLDAALHVVTAASLRRWADDVDRDMAAYPTKIEVATFHAPPPTSGQVEVDLRFDGFRAGPRFPAVKVHLSHDGKVWATLVIVLVLVSRGRLRALEPALRQRFVRDREFAPGVGLSTFDGPVTHVRMADVQVADWLDGTVSWLYDAHGDLEALSRQVVVKDHVAQQLGLHPHAVDVNLESGWATSRARPLCCYPFRTRRELMGFLTETTGMVRLDPSPLMLRWRTTHGLPDGWLGEDLYRGLLRHLVHEVTVPSTEVADALGRGPVLFVVTSSLPLGPLLWHATLPAFTARAARLAGALSPPLDELVRALEDFAGGRFPTLRPFPASSPDDLIAQATRELTDLVLHLDGPCAVADPRPILEAARAAGRLIVPMAISADAGHLRPALVQIGTPIPPDDADPEAALVATARLAGRPMPDRPLLPLAEEARAWSDTRGVSHENALIFKVLQNTPAPGEDTRRLIESIAAGRFTAARTLHDAWLTRWVMALGGPDVDILSTP